METHPVPYNPWDPPPQPPPHPPPDFEWGGHGGDFPPDNFHHHHFDPPPDFFHGPPDHFFNGPPDQFDGGGNGGFGHPNPNFHRKRKFDRPEMNGNFVKLYVETLPRSICQAEVSHLFEEFGHVIEVVLLTDKRTGLRQEYFFVKYASTEEADGAIAALHNQFTFSGGMAPLQVRYADGERKRLEGPSGYFYGALPLFCLEASYGCISRLRLLQVWNTLCSRIRPFLDQVRRNMIQLFQGQVRCNMIQPFQGQVRCNTIQPFQDQIFASYGDVVDIYLMRDELKQNRGCGFVEFTQKCMAMAAINGLNGTYMMRGCDRPLIVRFADPKKPKYGDFRQVPHLADIRRNNVSNPSHVGNLSTCTKLSSTAEQAGTYCPMANQSRPHETQQILRISPSRLSQMSLQESQILQSPMAVINVEQKQACEHCSRDLSEIDDSEAFKDCDWSEHICPDGDKYYFNCVTSESRWEKPEEFAVVEQRIQRLKSHPHSVEAPPTEGKVQCQQKSCDSEKPQETVSCAVEHSREVESDEPSSMGGPSLVQ